MASVEAVVRSHHRRRARARRCRGARVCAAFRQGERPLCRRARDPEREAERSARRVCPRQQLEALRDRASAHPRFPRKAAARILGVHRAPTARVLGQRVTPLERVGLYVPGGKAAYPSSVLMNAMPAKVAGVRELVMVSPNPDPLVLAAAALAGVDRVVRDRRRAGRSRRSPTAPRRCRASTRSSGPGNAYVAEAKRQVFGAGRHRHDRRPLARSW